MEGDVVREPGAAGRAVQALKPGQRRVERADRALGEPHHGDRRGIDPRVRGPELEGPVGVADHRQAAELGLVFEGAGDGPAREAVEEERCSAGEADLTGPPVLAKGDPAGAVDEHHGRAPPGPSRGQVEVPQIRGVAAA